MKKIFLVLLIFGLFSCETVSEKDIYLGKLEELIIGDFSIKKDSLTKSIYNIRVVKDEKNEFIVTTSSARQFKGSAFIFRNAQTGEEEGRIEIPNEGPDAMKIGSYYLPINLNKIIALSPSGIIAEYDGSGKMASDLIFNLNLPDKYENTVQMQPGIGLMQYYDSFLQMGLNPAYWVSVTKETGPGEMRTSFPLDFENWLLTIDLRSGEVDFANFSIPSNYEEFQGDVMATNLYGDFDQKRGLFYLGWPYSNEVYVLENGKLQQKLIPKAINNFNFSPNEIIEVGEVWTAWVLPKEASKHIFLKYDEHRDLILKCTKINESGAGETKFERTKHYVLSVYTGDWRPLGEYLFDFESELDLENWFLTSQGLFINKPEQKSEDEYEFYKIDLSRFAN